MRPDKCSESEPIRTPFDPADIREPIRWLIRPHGEFLYRKGSPTCVSGVMWNLTHPATARFPSPLFTNYWTGEFDGRWVDRIGILRVEDFLSEMFRVTGSDYGLLTSEVDLCAKNRTVPRKGRYIRSVIRVLIPHAAFRAFIGSIISVMSLLGGLD